jgi:uncharacterized protein involved in copper resistance
MLKPTTQRALLDACVAMLKMTGGSRMWTGETQRHLEAMEKAVAEANTDMAEPKEDEAPETEADRVAAQYAAMNEKEREECLRMIP